MRIVAIADTHMNESRIESIPDGDVFIHAGDLTCRGPLKKLHQVANWLNDLPHQRKIVVAGNHDFCLSRHPRESIKILGNEINYLEDSGIEIDGIKFWGSPWQPEFNNWAFNLPRGKLLAEKWSLIPKDTDILITHSPPYGFGDKSELSERLGCSDLKEAVYRIKPLLHLFGHIHADNGVWTSQNICFANVTTSEATIEASVFDIDIEKRSVTHIPVPTN